MDQDKEFEFDNLTIDIAEVPNVIEPPSEPVNVSMGVVFDCEKLNVRVAPFVDAEVATVIDRDAEVMIDEARSTDEFYKVCTENSIEGYCMKKFIAVQP